MQQRCASMTSEAHAGGSSLHLCMTPHGPDTKTFEMATGDTRHQQPQRLPSDTLAFMFEVNAIPRVTAQALSSPCVDQQYYECWEGLRSHFTGPSGPQREAEPGSADAHLHRRQSHGPT